MSVAVLVPLLGRPDQVGPLLDSLRASEQDVKLRPYFLLSPHDDDVARVVSETECDHSIVPWVRQPGDYSMKMNLGVRMTTEPWVFLGARDLRFHVGWADRAIEAHADTGKRVIGTNDLANPLVKRGRHATHPLVARSYIEELGTIDEPGKVVHEGYGHCWVDNEFCETAMFRGEFVFAAASHVEHQHYIFRKGVDDETYQIGQKTYKADMRLFKSRRRLWARGRMRNV